MEQTNTAAFKLNAFPGNSYARVIAYKMNGDNTDIVNKQNKRSSAVVGEGVALTKKQEELLLTIYRDKRSYGSEFYRCFDPHLGFIFYDTSDNIVAHSTVCFQCNWMRTSPDIGAFIFSISGARSLAQLEGDIFEL
ncbi:MAG: hypothetical protein ACI8YQ_004761 [Polaribacter sp.]